VLLDVLEGTEMMDLDLHVPLFCNLFTKIRHFNLCEQRKKKKNSDKKILSSGNPTSSSPFGNSEACSQSSTRIFGPSAAAIVLVVGGEICATIK
jgi:hypothetical protein